MSYQLSTMNQQPLRQGDVILLPVQAEANSTPITGQPLPHLTLAEGEVTGHSHRISDGQAELRQDGGTLYLRVTSGTATLSHEEHRQIQIPEGTWIVRIQREYEPEGWQYVED